MVIDVITAAELLKQAGADPDRIHIAEAFIRRRSFAIEDKARRIEENAEGRLELDRLALEQIAPR